MLCVVWDRYFGAIPRHRAGVRLDLHEALLAAAERKFADQEAVVRAWRELALGGVTPVPARSLSAQFADLSRWLGVDVRTKAPQLVRAD